MVELLYQDMFKKHEIHVGFVLNDFYHVLAVSFEILWNVSCINYFLLGYWTFREASKWRISEIFFTWNENYTKLIRAGLFITKICKFYATFHSTCSFTCFFMEFYWKYSTKGTLQAWIHSNPQKFTSLKSQILQIHK